MKRIKAIMALSRILRNTCLNKEAKLMNLLTRIMKRKIKMMLMTYLYNQK
jgi:hypothetical protein